MRKSGKERKRRHELFCNGCEDLSTILNQRWEPFFCIQSEVTGKMIMIVSQTQLCVIMLWKVKEMVAVASKKVEEDLSKTSTSVQTRLWMQHVHVSKVLQLNSNQVKEGEGVDVLQGCHHQVQGCRHRPHLHPPLCHHLHSLHLPGPQRVRLIKDLSYVHPLRMQHFALCSNVPMFLTSYAPVCFYVPPCRCDTMSYYAITIFAEWGIPPTSVAILFQVYSIWFFSR